MSSWGIRHPGVIVSGVIVVRGECHVGCLSCGVIVSRGDCCGVIVSGVNVLGVNVAKPIKRSIFLKDVTMSLCERMLMEILH